MELIFNPRGEFRWSPYGPVKQIYCPHFHAGAAGVFSYLLRSVQMLKREWGAESETGSYRTYSIPGKITALVPEFAVKYLHSAELQPKFLRLQWRTCPWAEHCDNDDSRLWKQKAYKILIQLVHEFPICAAGKNATPCIANWCDR